MATEQQSALALRIARTFRATPDKVFRAWTTPEALKRWCAPGDMTTPVAEVDLKVGGRFRIHMRSPDGKVYKATGVYSTVDPPKKLVFTWRWEDSPGAVETLITLEFTGRGDSTEMVLTHSRFPNEAMKQDHEKGWLGSMDKLAAAVA